MADGHLRTRFLILLTEKEQRDGRRIKNMEIVAGTGVSLPTVHRWLKGDITKFDAPVIEAFCKYFDCQVGDLLYIEENENSSE